MSNILTGDLFKLSYSEDPANNLPIGVGVVDFTNIAAMPTLQIDSQQLDYETYDSEYKTVLLSSMSIQPFDIVVNYVPDEASTVFLDSMAKSRNEFQVILNYEQTNNSVSYAIVSGTITATSTAGSKDSVVQKSYTFTPYEDIVSLRTMLAANPLYEGNYGVGSNGDSVPQYEPVTPTGNSFIKVSASQSGNPASSDLMGIGLIDGSTFSSIAMTKTGALNIYAKNGSTAWTRILTSSQIASQYMPLAGGTITGTLTLTQPLGITSGGTGNNTGQSPSTLKLANSRTFITNLASTTASGFDGTSNNSHGVTGILPITSGGTGNATGLAPSATVLATARTISINLASTTAASFNGSANVTPGVSGTLPIANGGTGASNAVDAAYNLATMPRRGNMPDGANCDDYGPTSTTIGIWSIGTVAATSNQNLPEVNQGVFEVFQAGPYAGTQRFTTRGGNMYVRSLTASWTTTVHQWGTWYKIGDQGVYGYVNGSADDVLTPGVYSITSSATGIPFPYAGILEVTLRNGTTSLIQEYTIIGTTPAYYNRSFLRTLYNTTWSPWIELANVGDNSALNYVRNNRFLSGGYLPAIGNSASATLEYVPNSDSRIPVNCPGAIVALVTKNATGTLHNLVFGVNNLDNNNMIPVAPGEVIDYSVNVAGNGITNTGQLRVVFSTYDKDGGLIANTRVSVYDPAIGGWQKLYGSYDIPANCVSLAWGVWSETSAPVNSRMFVTEPILTKQRPVLGLTKIGIGGDVVLTATEFDWQTADFLTSATYRVSSENMTNTPTGVTVASGIGVFIRVLGASASATRQSIELIMDTTTNNNYRIYEVLITGAKGSRVFTVRQLYTTANTTVDANGFLKTASPIVKLFGNGTCELNNESMGASTTRISEGVYRIEGVLGLNSNPVWSGTDGGFEIPLDRNKQPKLWLDYEVENDGSILVKTYHRIHSQAPLFARNEIEGYEDGTPIDIPSDSFISVRVEMPAIDLVESEVNEVPKYYESTDDVIVYDVPEELNIDK